MKSLFCALGLSLFTFAAQAQPVVLHAGSDQKVLEYVNTKDQVPLNLTIVATDTSGGQDSLAGAVLIDEVSGATYGAFVNSDQKGAYQKTLIIDNLVAVRPISYTRTGIETRILKAVVFNNAGQSTEYKFSIDLNGFTKWSPLDDSFWKEMPEYLKKHLATLTEHQNYYDRTISLIPFGVGVTFNSQKQMSYVRALGKNSYVDLYETSGDAIYNEFKAFAQKHGIFKGETANSTYNYTTVSSHTFTIGCEQVASAKKQCWSSNHK